jgi:hypothetical protein
MVTDLKNKIEFFIQVQQLALALMDESSPYLPKKVAS